MPTVELTVEECDVADDLRRAAEYGTEWDEVLKAVAQKLDQAKTDSMQRTRDRFLAEEVAAAMSEPWFQIEVLDEPAHGYSFAIAGPGPGYVAIFEWRDDAEEYCEIMNMIYKRYMPQ